jgi:predicted outer membrane repeat protein
VSITNSTLSANQATAYAGAVYNFSGTMNITTSTRSGNSAADRGGAAYNNSGTMNITNSTLSGNSTPSRGGGIYSLGTLKLLNSTLSGNSATTGGGGIYFRDGTVEVQNTIIAENTGTAGPNLYNYSPSFTSLGNNLIGDDDGGNGFTNGVNGDLVGDTISPLDPLLGALSNNGGTTQTRALLAGSPAIDAGDDTACAASPVNAVDQRGTARPQGTHCDIGAFEVVASATTSVPAAIVPTAIPAPALCSLTGFASSTQVAMSLPNGNNGLNVCYSLITDPAQAGVTQLFALAAEVYTFDGYGSVTTGVPVQVCLQGVGTLLYRSAVGQPRVTVNLPSFSQNGFTCGLIPNAGTVILIPGAAAPAAAIPPTALSNCRVTTTNILNLRAEPDANSAVLTKVPYQTTLSASARSGEWLQVVFGGQQGWVSASYLSLTGDCG